MANEWDALTKLRDCLCEAIEDADIDPVCACVVLPGAQASHEYISGDCTSNGMAWVRATSQYLTESFPTVLTAPQRCGAEVVLVVEVAMIRSFDVSEDGEPPDAAEMEALTQRQIEESVLMRKAILCCYGRSAIIGQYQPTGPQGAVIGGRWLVSIPTSEADE